MAYLFAYDEYKEKYFTDNIETNAFFQQFAHFVDETFSKADQSELIKLTNDFKYFYNTVSKHLNQEQLNVFERFPKYKEKLIKRIYKLWDFMRSKPQ